MVAAGHDCGAHEIGKRPPCSVERRPCPLCQRFTGLPGSSHPGPGSTRHASNGDEHGGCLERPERVQLHPVEAQHRPGMEDRAFGFEFDRDTTLEALNGDVATDAMRGECASGRQMQQDDLEVLGLVQGTRPLVLRSATSPSQIDRFAGCCSFEGHRLDARLERRSTSSRAAIIQRRAFVDLDRIGGSRPFPACRRGSLDRTRSAMAFARSIAGLANEAGSVPKGLAATKRFVDIRADFLDNDFRRDKRLPWPRDLQLPPAWEGSSGTVSEPFRWSARCSSVAPRSRSIPPFG